MKFASRTEAGKRLGEALLSHAFPHPLVLALPRGGVPVAGEVARILNAPLDTLVVRKIGAPLNPEWAVGALAPHGVVLIDDDALKSASISRASVDGVIEKERAELNRRVDTYKSGTYSAGYVPETLVIVDDGVANGYTARAALLSARKKYPKTRIIFASPVCLLGSFDLVSADADEVVCLDLPEGLYAVGQAYEEFVEVSDEEVRALLQSASDSQR
ncbi:MAG: phosphoribosyltransferase [Parcubacteria group bacterium Athens0416_74]|nr:MAG: phosphoribosyltransferase [Parcubacteria group bacterium Athens0416_74]